MTLERRLTHLIGATRDRTWRTMAQLVAAGLFPSADAARMFCRRHRGDLVLGRKGRALLVDQRSLDRLFERDELSGAVRRKGTGRGGARATPDGGGARKMSARDGDFSRATS